MDANDSNSTGGAAGGLDTGTMPLGSPTTVQGCLTHDAHPQAVSRKNEGKKNLTFNERVTVHSVPPYDPSRFSYVPEFDPVDNSGGGNCCTIS